MQTHLNRHNGLQSLETQMIAHPPLEHVGAVRAPQPPEQPAVVDLLGRVTELNTLLGDVFVPVREQTELDASALTAVWFLKRQSNE